MSCCCSLAFKACRCMSSGHVSTCLGFAGHLESATIEREHTENIGKLCLHHCKTQTGGTTSWTTSCWTAGLQNGLVLELCQNFHPKYPNGQMHCCIAVQRIYCHPLTRLAENGSFQKLYRGCAPSSGPETQGFIPSWWQGRSANLQTPTHSRCTAKQTSSKICVVCKCLSFFYISANQSYHVWNARHCFKLYDIFFCALWVSKFTWFQHWEKEILRIMLLLLGNDARLERWRCSWSASSWTLMLWLARQSHEIRDDYVQLQRFQYIKNLSEPFECEYFYF
jgi:hypothetical protein